MDATGNYTVEDPDVEVINYNIAKFQNMCYIVFANGECDSIFNVIRIIETVGYILSIISLLIAIYIFKSYRTLKNNRTLIHRNLCISSVLHTVFRLLWYSDQHYEIFSNNNYISISCITLVEYGRTALFTWMFIEGLYLNNVITVAVFHEHSYMKWYFFFGWLAPVLITFIWLIRMVVMSYKLWSNQNNVKLVWTVYSYLPYYWITEGPRNFMLVLNLIFLLNIIRILVVKLKEINTQEGEKIKKAVRAAIFLLPLLGINNFLFLLDVNFDQPWKMALWSYTSYFFASFQGFFIFMLYCVLNGEVQAAIRRSLYLRMSLKNTACVPSRNVTLMSFDQNVSLLNNNDKVVTK